MPTKVVAVAQSKWTFRTILSAWVLSLAYLVHRGWTWENHEALPEGSRGIGRDYFDSHRMLIFIWLSLLLTSYGAYFLKKKSVRSFGYIEIGAGMLAGYFDIATVPLNHIDAWVALIVAAYAVVSGAEHISELP